MEKLSTISEVQVETFINDHMAVYATFYQESRLIARFSVALSCDTTSKRFIVESQTEIRRFHTIPEAVEYYNFLTIDYL